MAWVRIHDGALTHPKLVGLSDRAFRLWVWGLCYSQMHLTDGAIPEAAIPSRLAKAVEELTRGRLWEETADGVTVHDYLDWNDSRDLVKKKRTEAKERMANARERSSRELLRRVGLEERSSSEEKKGDEVRPMGPALRSRGAMGGSLPSDHLHHEACDATFSWCVPRVVHTKLVNKLAPKYGGNRDAAAAALRVWYPVVWATLAADFVIPGDDFKFWTGRFDAAFASQDSTAAPRREDFQRSTVPTAEETRLKYFSEGQ